MSSLVEQNNCLVPILPFFIDSLNIIVITLHVFYFVFNENNQSQNVNKKKLYKGHCQAVIITNNLSLKNKWNQIEMLASCLKYSWNVYYFCVLIMTHIFIYIFKVERVRTATHNLYINFSSHMNDWLTSLTIYFFLTKLFSYLEVIALKCNSLSRNSALSSFD